MKEQIKHIPGIVPTVRKTRELRDSVRRSLPGARFYVARARRARAVDKYLRNHSVRRLQLGAGNNPYPRWLNTDVVDFTRRNEVIYLDARKPFPLPDDSFDTVFTEHMIEHLTYAEGRHCLAECRRILRPDGLIRVATPSLEQLIALYGDEQTELQHDYLQWSIDTFAANADVYLPGFVLNNMFRNFGHEFVYDKETLSHSLQSAGFVDIEEFPVGESNAPELKSLERHMRRVADFNAYETLVLEAKSP
ncbi:MAG TPA: methyltransferase domain-containing protein [Gaiellaceae bacterium]|jgi:predicted SAM-dependent methyltransferase